VPLLLSHDQSHQFFLQVPFLNAQVVNGIGGSEAGEHHFSLRAQTAVYAKHNDKRRGT
jgi:hypothetical protein